MAFFAGQKTRPGQFGTGGNLPQGILARGNRPTTSATTTTTEIGVLRIDGIPVVAGRAYRIWTDNLFLISTVTNDNVAARFRVSTSGAATVSSTPLGNYAQQKVDAGFPPSIPLQAIYIAPANGTLSVILTVVRNSGTGNASLFVAENVVVEDIGIDPGDTGVDL